MSSVQYFGRSILLLWILCLQSYSVHIEDTKCIDIAEALKDMANNNNNNTSPSGDKYLINCTYHTTESKEMSLSQVMDNKSLQNVTEYFLEEGTQEIETTSQDDQDFETAPPDDNTTNHIAEDLETTPQNDNTTDQSAETTPEYYDIDQIVNVTTPSSIENVTNTEECKEGCQSKGGNYIFLYVFIGLLGIVGIIAGIIYILDYRKMLYKLRFNRVQTEP